MHASARRETSHGGLSGLETCESKVSKAACTCSALGSARDEPLGLKSICIASGHTRLCALQDFTQSFASIGVTGCSQPSPGLRRLTSCVTGNMHPAAAGGSTPIEWWMGSSASSAWLKMGPVKTGVAEHDRALEHARVKRQHVDEPSFEMVMPVPGLLTPLLRGVPHGIPIKTPEDATATTGGLRQCELRDLNHSGDGNAMVGQ
ncbi:hypothetical protein BJY52DRAFT_1227703 [Lactarius psammicola]|nr:hypothetical protein BJY52DRAFT_1227703 [Lactarius psammicola]